MTSTPQEYFNKVQALKRQGKSAATKYISFDAAILQVVTVNRVREMRPNGSGAWPKFDSSNSDWDRSRGRDVRRTSQGVCNPMKELLFREATKLYSERKYKSRWMTVKAECECR